MAIRFDLRHLRYFVTVAEEGSFRKAAERLHLSQPPLSRQIRDLEAALDATLFVRSPEGVLLSPAGEALLPRAAALLADAEALPEAISSARPSRKAALRIGITLAVQHDALPRLERAWRRIAPKLEVTTAHTPDLIARVRKKELGFALVGLPGDTGGLHFEVVDTEPLLAVVPSAHPAARKQVVSLRDFDGLPLFWWQRAHNPVYFDHAQSVFRDLGYRPKLVYVEPGQYLTLERISRGEGITLLNAQREAIPMKGVAYRRLKENARLAIRVAAVWIPGEGDERMEALATAAVKVLHAARDLKKAKGRRTRG
jgi:DNA-binding transcriptional LysR family regulator